MARPVKIGLDYFPLDTNIDTNDKIQLIEAEFGSKGFAIVIKLLCKIYAEKGYYYNWTEVEKLLFAKKMGESVGLVDEIVKRSVKWGLFDESVFNQFQVLTSSAIQSRFLEAVSRRENIEIYTEFLLFDISAYKNKVNVNINSINTNISTQSKVKEIKVKESIRAVSPAGDSSLPKSNSQKPINKKQIIDKIDFVKLLEFINKQTGRSFEVINDNTKKKFRARLKDGYMKKVILKAIENAAKSDYHKSNNCQYLTPEFFSRADTLDKYGNDTTAIQSVNIPKEEPQILGPWAS